MTRVLVWRNTIRRSVSFHFHSIFLPTFFFPLPFALFSFSPSFFHLLFPYFFPSFFHLLSSPFFIPSSICILLLFFFLLRSVFFSSFPSFFHLLSPYFFPSFFNPLSPYFFFPSSICFLPFYFYLSLFHFIFHHVFTFCPFVSVSCVSVSNLLLSVSTPCYPGPPLGVKNHLP